MLSAVLPHLLPTDDVPVDVIFDSHLKVSWVASAGTKFFCFFFFYIPLLDDNEDQTAHANRRLGAF